MEENQTLAHTYNAVLSNHLSAFQKEVISSIYHVDSLVLCGSISLVACGLLSRQPKDIDVLIERRQLEVLTKILLREFNAKKIESGYNHNFRDLDGQQFQHFSYELTRLSESAKLCVFTTNSKPKLAFTSINIVTSNLVVPVRISPVNHAISAKIGYSQSTAESAEKHKIDLENISNVLTSAFGLILNDE